MLVCHQNDVCQHSNGSDYVGEYGGLSESGLCVFRKLCPVGFLVVCKIVCSLFLLQSIVMYSHVLIVSRIVRWSDDSGC